MIDPVFPATWHLFGWTHRQVVRAPLPQLIRHLIRTVRAGLDGAAHLRCNFGRRWPEFSPVHGGGKSRKGSVRAVNR